MQNDKKTQTKPGAVTSVKSARRELLSSSAAAAASMAFGLLAVACSDDDGDTSGDAALPATDSGTPSDSAVATDAGVTDAGGAVDADIASLNALLTAEYNAITAYTAGAGLIVGAKESDPLYALRTVIKDIAVDFQSHHKLHAAALVNAITTLSGTQVTEASVAAKFAPPAALTANPSISNVLKFAASAERGAAVSYNKVVASLEAAKLRYLATVIEGDESQHFIVLAALVLGLAGPGAALNSDKADDVVPQPFVRSVNGQVGLEKAPANYFA
jgi:hypothetical protein